jgi:hypothetical protein
MIKINVSTGDDQQTFRLSESRLCEKSDYFEQYLHGPFAEASSKEICLHEVDSRSFCCFV